MQIEQIVSLNEAAKKIYEANKEKGFWDKERNFGELLMLVVSELGEAIEAHRKGRNAYIDGVEINMYEADGLSEKESTQAFVLEFKTYVKDSWADEIADAIIRLLDMAGGLGIDIERHINMKLAYNKTREKLHGKAY
jgi:NTP pyrophosphatase (non-canonical NTP hydrolase)